MLVRPESSSAGRSAATWFCAPAHATEKFGPRGACFGSLPAPGGKPYRESAAPSQLGALQRKPRSGTRPSRDHRRGAILRQSRSDQPVNPIRAVIAIRSDRSPRRHAARAFRYLRRFR